MTNVKQLFPQWETLPVHPVNDAPMMSDAELKELAADIDKNGLQEPIIFWRDNSEAANGSDGPFPVYLLDGRNRLAALKLLGITDPNRAPSGQLVTAMPFRTVNAIKQNSSLTGHGLSGARWVTDVDPAAMHLSLNVYRRHLKGDQRSKEIAKMIAIHPTATDAEISRKTGVSNKTVAKVRDKSVRILENPISEHRPIERAKAAILANPDLTHRQVKDAVNVGVATAHAARKQLEETGAIQPRAKKTAAPKPKPEPAPKQANPTEPKSPKQTAKQRRESESAQAAEELVEWLCETTQSSGSGHAMVATWIELLGGPERMVKLLKGGNK